MAEIRPFVATGVGSLPCRHPGPALDLIFRYLPEIAHWPQLPRRSAREGFVRQYVSPLVEMGLVEGEGGGLCFATSAPDWPERLTRFYALYLEAVERDEALEAFAFPRDAAEGFYAFLERAGKGEALFVKGQVSGPVTLGFQVTDPSCRASFYDPQLRDLLLKTLEMHVRWQVRALARTGLPVILFIDDPGLYAFGQSTSIALGREEIGESLNTLYDAAHREGALVGTHCCAGIDWSLLTESRVDILNFDAYEYFNTLLPYTSDLAAFLERGGLLAWGLVPTSPKIDGESVKSLLALLSQQLDTLAGKGIPRHHLEEQAMLTPSCGTGSLTPEQAERVYQLTAGVSGALR